MENNTTAVLNDSYCVLHNYILIIKYLKKFIAKDIYVKNWVLLMQ